VPHMSRVSSLFLVSLLFSACTTSSTSPTPSGADRAARQVVRALVERDVGTIPSFVADQGVNFPTKWPGGIDPSQSRPMSFVSRVLVDAVLRGDPSCVGYDPAWGALPTRSLLVIGGLPIDWAAAGVLEFHGDLAGLVLTKLTAEEWAITIILPVYSVAFVEEIGDLTACP